MDHVVTIEKATNGLPKMSYIECSQPYTVLKKIFTGTNVKYMGKLSPEKMAEVDEALYVGLNMGGN